jgi:hypothetical protein
LPSRLRLLTDFKIGGKRGDSTGLRAAVPDIGHHCRPADCTDAQRLDVHNGLLLSALWDAAFDRGLISFADDGTVLASPRLSETAPSALGLGGVPPLSGLHDAHRTNLAIHRTRNGFG